MLTRTAPHALLMDEIYRRQRHLYDFTRKFYLFGRDGLIRALDLAPGERVVEIGCGTARNLIALARRYPGARLYGLDASEEMLKTAAASVSRAGLEERVHLVRGLAEELSPGAFGESAPFDRAIFPYSLSMIPQWEQALMMAAHSVRPSTGEIAIVDFADFAGLPAPFAGLMRRWLSLFHVSPRIEFLNAAESSAVTKSANLCILPGRYAFVWRGTAEELGTCRVDVAEGSQDWLNPELRRPFSTLPMDIQPPLPSKYPL
ncbi:MAG TPA: class I SAM-dependent methyltransferase [Rhizomicrobium sp.]|nr:class I SAM-dependent methyltransferase [Rhizomicrobium sp.]